MNACFSVVFLLFYFSLSVCMFVFFCVHSVWFRLALRFFLSFCWESVAFVCWTRVQAKYSVYLMIGNQMSIYIYFCWWLLSERAQTCIKLENKRKEKKALNCNNDDDSNSVRIWSDSVFLWPSIADPLISEAPSLTTYKANDVSITKMLCFIRSRHKQE